MQPRHGAFHHGEARARELDAHLEIEAQGRAEVDMVPRRERRRRRVGALPALRAPAPYFEIRMLVFADWHAGVRKVRHRKQQRLQFRLQGFEPRAGAFLLGLERVDLAISASTDSPLAFSARSAC